MMSQMANQNTFANTPSMNYTPTPSYPSGINSFRKYGGVGTLSR
jgi:hypothetical protein